MTLVALVVGGLLGLGGTALAQTAIAWSATANGDFSVGSNWTGGTAPADSLTTNFASFNNATGVTVNIDGNRSVAGLDFGATAGAYTVSRTGGATRTLTLGAYGVRTSGANDQVITGASLRLTLGAASSFQVNGTGDLTISSSGNSIATTATNTLTLQGATTGVGTVTSVISGAGTVTKNESGTWILSGANTFSGGLVLNDGVLRATTNAGALGGGPMTLAGGTLQLANDANLAFNRNTTVSGDTTITVDRLTAGTAVTHTLGTLSIGAQTLTINGGANFSANNTGSLTFGSTTLTGNATLALNNTNGTGVGITTLGALSDGGAAKTLTKTGDGTLTLATNTTNIVSGTAINVTAGTLNSNNTSSLGTLANVTLSNSANLGIGATQTLGALNGTSGTTTTITGTNILTIGSTNNLNSTYAGTISGASGGRVTKAGTGTLNLSGTNTYTGLTTVSGGTLLAQSNAALGASSGAVTVSGGTLALDAGINVTKSATLTLTGTGASGAGALRASGGTGTSSQWTGNISLGGAATISAADNLLLIGEGNTFSNTIALGANTLTFNTTSSSGVTPTYLPFPAYTLDSANIVVNSAISGTGGITKTGPGTLMLIPAATGGSTFSGATTITGGKVIVDAIANTPAINSTQIYVGNSASPGAADTVVLQMGQLASAPATNNIIGTYNAGTNSSFSSLTVYADGLFNMNGASNGFIALTLQGGHVSGGNASYSPLLTLTGAVATTASTRTALIDNGNLAMSANSFTFTVASGASNGIDLQIDSALQNGAGYTGGTAGTSLAKAGVGAMLLTSANTYSGVTNVSAGTLIVQNAAALGQVGSFFGDTANGTTVASGAQLQLRGGITVGTETLTVNGTGVSTTGALRNYSGNNTYTGFITLAGATNQINADAGTTLTIANPSGVNASIINGSTSGRALTFAGDGNVIVNGGIQSNVSTVAKTGAGTVTLAGTNTYAGATTVASGGAIKVTNSNGLSGTGVTVSDGGALQFAQDASNTNISVVGVAANIRGTGLSSGGAIQNLTGDNSYLGALTLAAATRITANSGSSLALSGSVTGAGFALDAGGAGNTTYSGVIAGTGTALTKSDAGTVTLSGTSANTFTGGVTVSAGTLALSKTDGLNATGTGNITVANASGANLKLLASNQISNTASVTVLGSGKFDLNGFNETIGSFAGTGTIDVGTGKLTVTGASSFGGSLAGTGILEKTGAGALTFTSSINFSGGELSLINTTLSLAGVNLTVGTLRITGNTTLDFGSSAASILTATNLILENGATLTITNWVDNIDFFYATGSFTGYVAGVPTAVTPDVKGVAPQNTVTFTGFSGNATTWQAYDRQITPTPEPATYGALFLGSCVALLGWRRYRRSRATVAA